VTEPTWFHELLATGDAEGLARAFAGEPTIDDPRAGRVRGIDATRAYVLDAAMWMAGLDASVEAVHSTRTEQRHVDEAVLHLALPDGRWALPVTVVSDRDGDAIGAVRVYHSMWPLLGEHRVREPLLEPDPTIELTGAPADYMRALAAGDVAGIMAAYEPDAVVREPSGGPYTYAGADRIREIYTAMFSAGGGIRLAFCTATDDGTACAVEFVALRWGHHELPRQAGVAVYERGSSGRLAAARIYDDVTPPPFG